MVYICYLKVFIKEKDLKRDDMNSNDNFYGKNEELEKFIKKLNNPEYLKEQSQLAAKLVCELESNIDITKQNKSLK